MFPTPSQFPLRLFCVFFGSDFYPLQPTMFRREFRKLFSDSRRAHFIFSFLQPTSVIKTNVCLFWSSKTSISSCSFLLWPVNHSHTLWLPVFFFFLLCIERSGNHKVSGACKILMVQDTAGWLDVPGQVSSLLWTSFALSVHWDSSGHPQECFED